MNLIILDLETTGLDPQKHEIIEIGAVRVAETAVTEEFIVKVHPLHIKDANQEALQINGYSKEKWADALMLPEALKLLGEFVGENAYFMAYNATFDWSFLQKAYHDMGRLDPFYHHHLDLMTMVWANGDPKLMPLSLKNTCTALDIPPESQIHTALGGARKAYEVYKALIK